MSHPPKRPRRSCQLIVQDDVRKLTSITPETREEDHMNQTQEQRMRESDLGDYDDEAWAHEDMGGRIVFA